jgi:hypothetical protein
LDRFILAIVPRCKSKCAIYCCDTELPVSHNKSDTFVSAIDEDAGIGEDRHLEVDEMQEHAACCLCDVCTDVRVQPGSAPLSALRGKSEIIESSRFPQRAENGALPGCTRTSVQTSHGQHA